MTSASRDEPRRLLRWIFHRGNQLLTCQLVHTKRDDYKLSLRSGAHYGVETFETGLDAFQRHATVTSQLRELGWKLVAHTGRAVDRRVLQGGVA